MQIWFIKNEMNRLIYSYALLKALIDESQDYIDAFNRAYE